ncbi:MAG TPA: hypothetical protein VKF16_12590 [Candidatus Dormibacteraeota bacterium]|nr:hypothetical protein [Candidatus Dormibacteraeota bacterium]
MGYIGVVFALFTLGYIFGVWTALLVTKEQQRAYEDGSSVSVSDLHVIALNQGVLRP